MNGYVELDHTADWAIRVKGRDFVQLLENASVGMCRLMGLEIRANESVTRAVEISARDREELLVAFLEEVLYIIESEGFGFSDIDLQLSEPNALETEYKLHGTLCLSPIESHEKEIKAVTYHGLEIKAVKSGLEAVLVFDV